jgi:GTP-binding protein
MKTIAIIGRPNVGKSTLFNRLSGKQHALAHDLPGVTRDVREIEIDIVGTKFILFDTAGLDGSKGEQLSARMSKRAMDAFAKADIGLFVIDGRVGVTVGDEEIVAQIRRYNKPVILLVNKAEGKAADQTIMDAFALGFGEPIAISASHGQGMNALATRLFELTGVGEQGEEAPRKRKSKAKTEEELIAEEQEEESKPIHIAIVGRPNAGKSTYMNALLKEDRVLTGPEAGITRDAIAVNTSFKGRAIKLIDTAGMRRKSNVTGDLEQMAVSDTLRTIQYAHVVVVMLDATQPFEKQDLAIADLVEREGRALVLALNKWDLIDNEKEHLEEMRYRVAKTLPQLSGVPLVPLSAELGRHVGKVIQAALEAYAIWNKRISTGQLNRWLEAALAQHAPPLVNGRRLKFRYMSQSKTRPPTFYLSSNLKDAPESYLRYLTNQLRDQFDMPGVPIRLMIRTGKNPYEK